MDDSSDLQARIARLAGRINRHKTNEPAPPNSPPGSNSSRRLAVSPGNQHELSSFTLKANSRAWVPQRGTPYGVPRGRGWSSRPSMHRNRTLVVKSTTQEVDNRRVTNPIPTPSKGIHDKHLPAGWVTKHDRHMQLINNNVYEQKTQERTLAMAETRRQKEIARDEQEKAKLNIHLRTVAGNEQYASPNKQDDAPHQILVKNIRFLVADGGSKLIKARDDANLGAPTPKRANIGGVTFLRSRNGNLYRGGLVRTMRSGHHNENSVISIQTNDERCSRTGIRKVSEPCVQFSTSGSCLKGPQCRYTHDPEKVSICRDFLQTGKCQAGDDCDLSHDPTPERVPACLHFLRGNCTNAECRYAHIKTNPGAPVCRAFAALGYCPKGAECAERHVHECPDYANKGTCRNPKCRLPHVDRAGQLRKAAAAEDPANDDGTSSDVSSDAGLDSDDVDSDEFDEDNLMPSDADNHELSQQVDFVHF